MSKDMSLYSRLYGLNQANRPELKVYHSIPRNPPRKGDWNYFLDSIHSPIFVSTLKVWKEEVKATLKEFCSYSYSKNGYIFLGKGKGRGFRKVFIAYYFSLDTHYRISVIFLEGLAFICVPKPIKVDRAFTSWGSYKGTFIELRTEELEGYGNTIRLADTLYNLLRRKGLGIIHYYDFLMKRFISEISVLIRELKELLSKPKSDKDLGDKKKENGGMDGSDKGRKRPI